jgi:hypothetical protein
MFSLTVKIMVFRIAMQVVRRNSDVSEELIASIIRAKWKLSKNLEESGGFYRFEILDTEQ